MYLIIVHLTLLVIEIESNEKQKMNNKNYEKTTKCCLKFICSNDKWVFANAKLKNQIVIYAENLLVIINRPRSWTLETWPQLLRFNLMHLPKVVPKYPSINLFITMKLCRIYMHPSTGVELAFFGCGVSENHRTIKIIIKGHAPAALPLSSCCCCLLSAFYAKMFPKCHVSHGGWFAYPDRVLTALGPRVREVSERAGGKWRWGSIKFEFHMLTAAHLPLIEGRLIKCQAYEGGENPKKQKKVPRCVKRHSSGLGETIWFILFPFCPLLMF